MKKYISPLIISLIFAACSNDVNEPNPSTVYNQDLGEKDIVLYERKPELPEVVTKEVELTPKVRTKSGIDQGLIGNSDILLGYSYRVGNSILGDYDNVVDPVVDVAKVKKIDPTYITGKKIMGNETRSFAYTDYSRYQFNSTITKKTSSGFSINIAKIFSIGRKKKTTEVFTKTIDNEEAIVFGELNIDIRNSAYSLQSAEGSRKIYSRQCLSDVFMKNLYSTPVNNVQETYGECVLTGYYTGGKAFGMYAGKSKSEKVTEAQEKDMTKDINASFTYKSSSGNGNLSFGKGNNSSTSNEYSTTQTEIYIKTLGGKRSGQAMVSAVPLKELSLDLSSWLQSLEDLTLHTIVDIQDQGLYPLSAFVLEENFRRRMDDSDAGYIEKRNILQIPTIEIIKVYVRTSSSGEPLYEVAAILNTKQGDKIILSDGTAATNSDADLKANSNSIIFNDKARKIASEKRKYYDLKITANAGRTLNPILRSPYLSIKIDGFNESRMYRFKNPETGIEYIYDTTKRIAFSHYTNKIDEDWILDEYGIRDWIESLPERKISMASLANSYKIIGL